MRDKVYKALSDFSMLCGCDRVVVALSGGADSVALLHALNSVKEKYGFTLYACHLNHNIRGEEAQRDEDFCKALCDKMGVELFLKSVDVLSLSKERKESLELCGRNCRYEFFSFLSAKLCCKVATAHTSSDNTETVIYNLARGTSLNGLCGIRPVRDYLIRPLIYCTRADVERYCEENALRYVTDSTNLSDDFVRNNIRHNIVPVLKGINADVENAFERMCMTVADVKAYLDKISLEEINKARTDYGYDCKQLCGLDKAVLYNAITLIVKMSGADISFAQTELVFRAMHEGGSVDLSKSTRVVCKQGRLRVLGEKDIGAQSRGEFEEKLTESSLARFISKDELKNVNKKIFSNCINCDIISNDTVIRNKKEGDMFTFYDRGVTKSLKKLFNEMKIPAEKRGELLVVANGNTVLWLQSVGVSKQGRCFKNESGAYLINAGESYE